MADHSSSSSSNNSLPTGGSNSKSCLNFLSLKAAGLVVLIIIGVALIIRSFTISKECNWIMNKGQWVQNEWYPYHCIINKDRVTSTMKQCLSSTNNAPHNVLFFGDKSLLTYYKAIVNEMTDGDKIEDFPSNEIEKNIPLTFSTQDKMFTADYVWSSKLVTQYYDTILKSPVQSRPSIIVHQHLEYDVANTSPIVIKSSCTDLVSHLINRQIAHLLNLKTELRPFIIMLLYDSSMLSDVGRECQSILETNYNYAKETHPEIRRSILLFKLPPKEKNPQVLRIITHFICHTLEHANCCDHTGKQIYQSSTVPLLVVLIAFYIGLVFVRATGTLIPLEPYFEGASIDLDYWYSVIHTGGTIIIALLYSCATDRLGLFVSAGSWQSLLLCFLLLIAVLCIGFMKRITLSQPCDASLVPKEQIIEWRGASVMILAVLEYTDMAETNIGSWLWVIMVSCISCGTSYSYFISLWDSGDLSLKGLIKVLFRHNYLAIWFCIVMGRASYGLYTVPAVMTQSVLIVYITIATVPKLTLSASPKIKVVIFKLSCALIIMIVLTGLEFHVEPKGLTSFLLGLDTNLRKGQMWTTPYIVRIISILGMAIAYYCKVHKASLKNTSLKIIFIILSLIFYGVFISLNKSITVYSQIIHIALVSLLILAYLTLRNLSNKINNTYSFFYKYFGSMSIEFYVLFQHAMLSHMTKGLVFLFPAYYSINMLATLAIVLYLSVRLREYSHNVNKIRVSKKDEREEEEEEEEGKKERQNIMA